MDYYYHITSIKVARTEDAADTQNVPTDCNGNLPLTTLTDHFPSAIGLIYKEKAKDFFTVEKFDQYLLPPDDGWGWERIYFPVFKSSKATFWQPTDPQKSGEKLGKIAELFLRFNEYFDNDNFALNGKRVSGVQDNIINCFGVQDNLIKCLEEQLVALKNLTSQKQSESDNSFNNRLGNCLDERPISGNISYDHYQFENSDSEYNPEEPGMSFTSRTSWKQESSRNSFKQETNRSSWKQDGSRYSWKQNGSRNSWKQESNNPDLHTGQNRWSEDGVKPCLRSGPEYHGKGYPPSSINHLLSSKNRNKPTREVFISAYHNGNDGHITRCLNVDVEFCNIIEQKYNMKVTLAHVKFNNKLAEINALGVIRGIDQKAEVLRKGKNCMIWTKNFRVDGVSPHTSRMDVHDYFSKYAKLMDNFDPKKESSFKGFVLVKLGFSDANKLAFVLHGKHFICGRLVNLVPLSNALYKSVLKGRKTK